MGVHSNTPALLAFNQSNVIDSAGRAVSSGILIACGAIGGIIGSLIFRGQDAPTYGKSGSELLGYGSVAGAFQTSFSTSALVLTIE